MLLCQPPTRTLRTRHLHSDVLSLFFFFNDTATTEIYTLSLHDALPISLHAASGGVARDGANHRAGAHRSEEHTSELQSLRHLVCRLLLEKKNQHIQIIRTYTLCRIIFSYVCHSYAR